VVVLKLSFAGSQGTGFHSVPPRLCVYLDSYGTAAEVVGPAAGMPMVTPVADNMKEFEAYLDHLHEQLERIRAEARERWGR
jgi:hypothetical protein